MKLKLSFLPMEDFQVLTLSWWLSWKWCSGLLWLCWWAPAHTPILNRCVALWNYLRKLVGCCVLPGHASQKRECQYNLLSWCFKDWMSPTWICSSFTGSLNSQIVNPEAANILIIKMAFENSSHDCRQALLSVSRSNDLGAYIRTSQNTGSPLIIHI